MRQLPSERRLSGELPSLTGCFSTQNVQPVSSSCSSRCADSATCSPQRMGMPGVRDWRRPHDRGKQRARRGGGSTSGASVLASAPSMLSACYKAHGVLQRRPSAKRRPRVSSLCSRCACGGALAPDRGVPVLRAQAYRGAPRSARAGAKRHAEDSTAPTQKPARLD